MQGSIAEIGLASVTGIAGVIALAAAAMGYARGPLAAWERILLGGAALALVGPGLIGGGAGFAILVVVFLRSANELPPPAERPTGARAVPEGSDVSSRRHRAPG